MMRQLGRWLFRLAMRLDPSIKWDLTTHEGLYTPCDDEWHCAEVRKKMRRVR